MLSSISQYVRMLDGRERGQVLEVNREIALDLIERKQAIAVEDVTAKHAFDPWDETQLREFRESRMSPEEATHQVPNSEVSEVKVRSETGEFQIPAAAVEVSIPRAKTKRR